MGSTKNLLETASLHGKSYLGAVKTKTLRIGSQDYSYFEGGKGKTVILLHGFGITKAFWRSIVPSLVSKFHLVALDIPGLDILNTPPSGRCTYPSLSQWLEEFINHQKYDKVHLVAQGLGAGIAIHYAADHQEQVRSVCLTSTPRWSKTENQQHAPIFGIFDKLEDKSPSEAIDEYFDTIIHGKVVISKIARGFYAKVLQKHGHRIKSLLQELERSLVQTPARMGLVKCPVLLIDGDKNAFNDVHTHEFLMRSFKLAEQHIMPACGTLPSLENPGEYSRRLTAFISEH